MKSKVIDEEDESFQRPDEETIAERTEATRLALEKITSSKVGCCTLKLDSFAAVDNLKCHVYFALKGR